MKENNGLKIGLIVGIIAIILLGAVITINVVNNSNQINENNMAGKYIKDLPEYKDLKIKKVVKATILHSTEAGAFKQYLTDSPRIKKLYEDIGNIHINEITDLMIMDAGESYVFEYEDGTEVRFSFEGSIFHYNGLRFLTDGIINSEDYMYVEQ